jgi:hypothetical protein
MNTTLVAIVAKVEPTLPPDLVLTVLDQVATNKAKRRRIIQALAANPELLTCGQPDGPIAVDQFIHALLAAGARQVVAPRCPDCGRPAVLPVRVDATRICLPCKAARLMTGRTCANCGRSFGVRSRDRQGRLVCRACRPGRDLDPVAAVVAQVAKLEPAMPLEVLQAAVAKVSKQRQDLVKLAWELEDRPALLTGEGAHGSPRLIRLLEELRRVGAEHVVMPSCPTCGRVARLTRGRDGVRVCRRCYDHATAKRCARCGRRRPASGRTADGQPLCLRCYHADPLIYEECARCGRLGEIRQRTPDAALCGTCYQLPTATCSLCGRTRPCFYAATGTPRCETCNAQKRTCVRCGNLRQAAARAPDGHLCWSCWRNDPASFKPCSSCQTVERLYHHGLCARCACDQRLQQFLTGPGLERLYQPLRDADPRQLMKWLRQPAVAEVLTDIAAGRCLLTHEALDQRLPANASRHLRGILVTAGLLQPRDEHLAAFERWLEATITSLSDRERQRLIRAFVTWQQLGRLRRRLRGRPANYHQIQGIRATVRAALALLEWLDAQQLTLASCDQADIDRWLDGPSTRYQARPFVQWAVEHHHANGIEIPFNGGRTQTRPLGDGQRWELARRLLHDSTIAIEDRVAGLFILLYAQPLAAIAWLTADRVRVDDTGVHVLFGDTPVRLVEPLAVLVAEHLQTRRSHSIVGRTSPTPWLFPGAHPDRHRSESHLGVRLQRLGIYARPSRHGALLELSAQLPTAVLSRLLGIRDVDRWTTRSGNSWANYAAAFQRRSSTQHPSQALRASPLSRHSEAN